MEFVGREWVEEKRGEIPLLDLVEAGEERDGDEDDDCFFSVTDFELWVGEKEVSSVCALPNRISE